MLRQPEWVYSPNVSTKPPGQILVDKKHFVRQMTFRTFYLFYFLTVLLLLFGLLTKDVEIIAASWHTTIIKGMWSFFIPTSIGTFLTGFIYHYWFKSGRPVRTRIIILHFSLVTVGLIFSLNIYRLTTLMLSSSAPDTTAISADSILFIILGPIILIVSLVVFIVGLVKTKRTST